MSRRLPHCFEGRVGGGSVRAVYVGAIANHGMILQFTKNVMERFPRQREDYFRLPSLEAQNSVLDAASLARSSGDVPDAVVEGDVVGAVLDVQIDWNFKSAVGVDEVDKGAVERLIQ